MREEEAARTRVVEAVVLVEDMVVVGVGVTGVVVDGLVTSVRLSALLPRCEEREGDRSGSEELARGGPSPEGRLRSVAVGSNVGGEETV